MRPGLNRMVRGDLLAVLGIGLLWSPNLHAQVRVSVPPGMEVVQPNRERIELSREPIQPQSGSMERDRDKPPALEGEESLYAWARTQLERTRAAPPGGTRTLQDRLEEVRAMYFLSVAEGDWVERGKDSLAVLRDQVPLGSSEEPIIQAYKGALEVVRAKHSRWPPNKLKYLNRGAEILDGLVEEHPENLEVRYLRLASYRFLPFFLSRDDAVAEDLRVLVAILPQEPEAFSPPIYRAVLRFVLDNTSLAEEDQARFEQALSAQLRANGDMNDGK